MPTRSTIMDANSYRSGLGDPLDPEDEALLERRERVLGGAYRLFYRRPVHLVSGSGQYVFDAQGTKYLDVYNNVPSIGHAHPAVTRAVTEQLRRINTHTRYLGDEIVDYTEELLATFPAEIDTAMYMCTGSEANDLAVRVAQEYSGGTGIIVTREAYHGTSYLTSGMSPALGSGQPILPFVRLVDPPDRYRVRTPDIGEWFAGQVQAAIDDLATSGVTFAGVLADSIFSSDGVFPDPVGMLRPVVDLVHRNGGIWIADEVQPGFGRTGDSFWGFARHGIVPDLVTIGKPMANGIPASGLLGRAEVMTAFSDKLPYFNTFGGNPVAMAAARAVLHVLQVENLQEHALLVGDSLREELRGLAQVHPCIGDIRGAGQFTGLELVEEPSAGEVGQAKSGLSEAPDPDGTLALDVIEGLRDRHVLTSVAGHSSNVLKLRPPLPFAEGDIDWLVGAIDETLTELGK